MSVLPKWNSEPLGTPLCRGIGGPSYKSVDERLAEIAAAIRGGADPDDFKEEMDSLLGTEMEEKDEEADAAWERGYRGGDE